ncbi:hypothetical protein MNBD_GAMMA12-1030 [hydrothermal vent metagenome]|uniref:Putative DNA-binding domain-containing protein n=1 Tax=hydrothermal vent metagenome TaxID=652676 RepID=A0A3B0YMR0_9ZZZZ
MATALREMQHEFIKSLLEKPSSIAKEIVSDEHASAERRLSLYAEGYKLRLKEVIEGDYEQVNAYLGDELFDQLMEQYISEYQSQHPNLRYYTQYMPTLLSESVPWSNSPEVSELAEIEKLFSDSFDSENRQSVTTQDLAQISPDAWPSLTIQFKKAVHLVSTQFNSFHIWQALSNEEAPPALVPEPSTWLIWRSDLISSYIEVSAAEAVAYKTMNKGGDFSALCEALLSFYDDEETPMQAVTLLQGWLLRDMIGEIK